MFCRFSRRYVFHRIDRVLANYRLHTNTITSSMNDAQRLEHAIVISRRYWGSPFGLRYWQILASYLSFRINRQPRAVQLLRRGRTLFRSQHRARGLGYLAAGALLAPEVIADVAVLPAVKPALAKLRGRPFIRRRRLLPQSEVWFGLTKAHDDGWAGPTLIMELDVETPKVALALIGTTFPDRLRDPLELEAFIDGRSLGRRPVGGDSLFSLTWETGAVGPGRHELRFSANTFMIPHDVFRNHDYRPLSYRVNRVEFTGRSATPERSPQIILPPASTRVAQAGETR